MLQLIDALARVATGTFATAAAQSTLWEFALVAALGLAGTAVFIAARGCFSHLTLTAGELVPSRIAPPRDISRMSAQSAPDAAGKPQPRAPGLVTATVG